MKRRKHEASTGAHGPGTAVLLGASFANGLAGVMHEMVWSRQLVRLIGAASFAQAVVVLVVFMGGLALGAALIGPRADRGRPLML